MVIDLGRFPPCDGTPEGIARTARAVEDAAIIHLAAQRAWFERSGQRAQPYDPFSTPSKKASAY